MGALFTHIINPFSCADGTKNRKIQEITLQSIREASQLAAEEHRPELWATCLSIESLPDLNGFHLAPALTQCVHQETGMETAPALPYIDDILRKGLTCGEAPYLIYTNMDIILQPHFYRCVAKWLEESPDAVVINRRRIPEYFLEEPLEKIWAQAGKPHPGFDCFILKKDLIRHFILDKICVGIPFVEVSLMHNIFAFAKTYRLETSLNLTLHIGEEVMPEINKVLYQRNRRIYEQQIYPQLKSRLQADRFPHYPKNLLHRMIHYLLNPSYRTHQMLGWETKMILKKIRTNLQDFRWRLLE